MQNPWVNLPKSSPYILKDDLPYIEKYNMNVSDRYYIHEDLLPEPFLGSFSTAKVILLNLNPGYDKKDDYWHKRKDFYSESRKNLLHESSPAFYLLNPLFKDSGGYIWWSKHLRELIEEVGIEAVAEKVMCIEYFPYHSTSYKELKSRELHNNLLPSQQYNVFLVKEAIKENKIILIMRSKKLWFRAVPELENYPYLSLSSSQSGYISKKNILDDRFNEIIEALI